MSMSGANINAVFATIRESFKLREQNERQRALSKSKPSTPQATLVGSETSTTSINDVNASATEPVSFESLTNRHPEPHKTGEKSTSRSRMPRKVSGVDDSESEDEDHGIGSDGAGYNGYNLIELADVPLSELRRRQRVEAELRRKCAELTKDSSDAPPFKPMKWNNPSIYFGDSPNSSLLGKRKSREVNNAESSAYRGTSSNSRLSSSSTSNSTMPIPMLDTWQNPSLNRQWTEEEADDFVKFADKWIPNKRFKR